MTQRMSNGGRLEETTRCNHQLSFDSFLVDVLTEHVEPPTELTDALTASDDSDAHIKPEEERHKK